LAGFGAYLTNLSESQKSELYTLLAQQEA